jgi:hypothetical protein
MTAPDVLKVYYVYLDRSTALWYYYDTDTCETTFERPSGALLLDPTTRRLYPFPDEELPNFPELLPAEPALSQQQQTAPGAWRHGGVIAQLPNHEAGPPWMRPTESFQAPDAAQGAPDRPVFLPPASLAPVRQSTSMVAAGAQEDSELLGRGAPRRTAPERRSIDPELARGMMIDPPASVADFHPVSGANSHLHAGGVFPDPRRRVLSEDLTGDFQKFQMADFANQYFREHRSGHGFGGRKISMDEITRFQSEPLKLPLLQALNKAFVRNAIDCFNLILTYTGANPAEKTQPGSGLTASRLVRQAIDAAELRDEVYFQLIKQTRENPNPECLRRTWELFVIVATLVPSSRNAENWIKSHFSQCARDEEDPTIADLAQFAHIRFSTRCVLGKPAPDSDIQAPSIERIPEQVSISSKTFGASIREQLWNQRSTFPRASIPIILHKMTTALFEKGAAQQEGIFRLPGNQSKVKAMQEAINAGGNPIPTADINDLASLFKSWFEALPEPIIDADMLPGLKNAFETKMYVVFVADLPHAHGDVLRYLIGFFKKLVEYEAVTNMNATNLAICIAPNLVDPSSVQDASQIRQFTDMITEFVVQLLATWDTRGIYPLPMIQLQAD